MGLTGSSADAVTLLFSAPARVLGATGVFSALLLCVSGGQRAGSTAELKRHLLVTGELAALLDVEERLGATDPYRQLGQLTHLILRRPPAKP